MNSRLKSFTLFKILFLIVVEQIACMKVVHAIENPNDHYMVTPSAIFMLKVIKKDSDGDFKINIFQIKSTSYSPIKDGDQYAVGWWITKNKKLQFQEVHYLKGCGKIFTESKSSQFSRLEGENVFGDVLKRKETGERQCMVSRYRNCKPLRCEKWSDHPDFAHVDNTAYIVKSPQIANYIFDNMKKMNKGMLEDICSDPTLKCE